MFFFFINGITNGFDIDNKAVFEAAHQDNNKSTSVAYQAEEDSALRKEVELGRYRIVNSRMFIVSPLGAVPKDGGDMSYQRLFTAYL